MRIDATTPAQTVLVELGQRLARVRKQRRLSQAALATAAGVGIATLRRIEDGKDSKLGSWLRLLVALQLDGAIENLLPAELRSPMAEARPKRSRRQGPPASPGTFRWGDQKP